MNGTERHARATRALHTGVALAVIFQLGASLVMEGPRAGRPDGLPLIAHQYVGLASLALILAFWLNLMARRIGTAPAALLPWFSAARRRRPVGRHHCARASAAAPASARLRRECAAGIGGAWAGNSC